uniref:Transmembrane protein n=1 Tax=Vitis vinifera TaxID=29760 RepID=F6H4W2_VITVI
MEVLWSSKRDRQDHNSKNIFERGGHFMKIGYNGGCLWLVRCRDGLRFGSSQFVAFWVGCLLAHTMKMFLCCLCCFG